MLDERLSLVRAALARLPPRVAEILLLKYTENWSCRDLAEHLGQTEPAIESRLHRARQRLRDELARSPLDRGPTMNIEFDLSRVDRDRQIDRLVSGDLPEAERLLLLRNLEAEPEGWRRCALAFLEDQAFRQAFAVEIARPEPIVIARLPSSQTGRRVRRFVMAAALLPLAFAAGFSASGTSRVDPVVAVTREAPARSPESPKVLSPEPVREVGWVELVDESSGESTPQRVPIISGPGLDDAWLRDRGPSLPEYVRAQWERRGYQVQERRNLMSITLEDGRKVSIPVDEVDLAYVGQQPL